MRDFAKEADVLANADLELAAIQLLQGKQGEALASYRRLILLGKIGDPKVRPAIEKAFERSVPLQIEAGKFQDAIDSCENYMKAFPQGRLVKQAQQWRDQMVSKGVHAGGSADQPASGTPPVGGHK